jgi:hypothetical protein
LGHEKIKKIKKIKGGGSMKENWNLVYEWYEAFEDEEEEFLEKKEPNELLNELLNQLFDGHGWYITEQP